MSDSVKNRMHNIELLRILSMFLIVITHALGHGGILENSAKGSIYYYLFNFIESFSVISVNIFVLISGYFLCESNFKLKKLVFLIIEVFIYNIIIFIILFIINRVDISLETLVYNIFPIITGKYWFATAYIILYILSPFLKEFVNKIERKTHFQLIIVCLILFCLIPTVFYFSDAFSLSGGYSFMWFIVLYFVAAYIRKYINFNKKKILLLVFIVSTILIFLSYLIIENYISFLNNRIFYLYNSVLVFISSISVFLLFLNIKIDNIKIGAFCNKIASCTFAIYLIHDNDLLRKELWGIINYGKYKDTWKLLVLFPVSVILIFLCCTLISFLFDWIIKGICNITIRLLKIESK